jgi:hypothetical protein
MNLRGLALCKSIKQFDEFPGGFMVLPMLTFIYHRVKKQHEERRTKQGH